MSISRLYLLLAIVVVLCKSGFAEEKSVDARNIEELPPPRITAKPVIDDGSGLAPIEVPVPLVFEGKDLKRDPTNTRVSVGVRPTKPNSNLGYGAYYPRMGLYTLFPVMGKLYCFDQTINNGVSAFRLNNDELPPGVRLGRDTFIFPSAEPRCTGTESSGGTIGMSGAVASGFYQTRRCIGGRCMWTTCSMPVSPPEALATIIAWSTSSRPIPKATWYAAICAK